MERSEVEKPGEQQRLFRLSLGQANSIIRQEFAIGALEDATRRIFGGPNDGVVDQAVVNSWEKIKSVLRERAGRRPK